MIPNTIAMKILGALTNPLYPAIGVEIFAAAMVDGAVKGEGEVIVEHGELVRRGEEALRVERK